MPAKSRPKRSPHLTTLDRRADLTEDALLVVMVISGVVGAIAMIVVMFAI